MKTTSEIRNDLLELVEKDLLGPYGGPMEELREEPPRVRYLLGRLAPHRRKELKELDASENEALDVEGEDSPEENGGDTTTVAKPLLYPSSIGLSFTIHPDAKQFHVKAEYGYYKRTRGTKEVENKETGEKEQKPIWIYNRKQVVADDIRIPLVNGQIKEISTHKEFKDVVVRGKIRKAGNSKENYWFVSLFLFNNEKEEEKDTKWIFQPELEVKSPDKIPIFISKRKLPDPTGSDAKHYNEEMLMAMNYRKNQEFAAGHNVAVHVETKGKDFSHAHSISTSVLPSYEIPITITEVQKDREGLSNLELDMEALSQMSQVELVRNLKLLPSDYESWVHDEAERAKKDEDLEAFKEQVELVLQNGEEAEERIREGIRLLAKDKIAYKAFCFANQSMARQRIRTKYTREIRGGKEAELDKINEPGNRSWRVFQLAFILINLPALTDLMHQDRIGGFESRADLLWFPTGGGKTEAYLGLTAYTIAVRRLQGEVEGHDGTNGIAVLMRYTLRLLTLQQFQRATALICAMEDLRREELEKGDAVWGKNPIRIGLWVGQASTPNRTEDAHHWLNKMKESRQPLRGVGSPAQLTHCPYCGTPINPGRNLHVDRKGQERTLTYCGDELGACLFTKKRSPDEGLPIVVVDEELYRLLPALVIATVDKFAQMPWNGNIRSLFGRVENHCPRHGYLSPSMEGHEQHLALGNLPAAQKKPCNPLRPPDLIIQDELHLISGPLGTLTGLYETAVDELCSWTYAGRKVRPKVIASTATIKQADEQMNYVFRRRLRIFPPQALDVADNYFSTQEKATPDTPGRKYLGVYASGETVKAALIRVYSAYLAAAQKLYENKDIQGQADPYMTLVGYFNSMRELGGMRRLVEDDISNRLKKMHQRGLARRYRLEMQELTSRKSAADIPGLLARLEHKFNPEEDKKRRDKKSDSPPPLDVLLATNMISVGVDISRLGLMVVTGQPKSTAEYIQATSRVGREEPGLVVTVYNWTRPRDTSHFESFEHYHATFYQQVESLSITPFAPRALDRGLAGVLTSLVRLLGAEFNRNQDAVLLSREHNIARLAQKAIQERGETLASEYYPELERMIKRLYDDWLELAQRTTAGGNTLSYQGASDGRSSGLLRDFHGSRNFRPGDDGFVIPNSLRDVEPMVNLVMDEGEGDGLI